MQTEIMSERKKSKIYISGWVKLKTQDYVSKGASFKIPNQKSFEISLWQADYVKYYVQLQDRELILFLNEENAKNKHVEDKILLKNVKSVCKTAKRRGRFGLNKESNKSSSIVITYNSKSAWNEVKIQTEKSDDQELWYKYIYTIALMKLPDEAEELLPGQIVHLEEIVQELSDLDKNSTDAMLPPYTEGTPTDQQVDVSVESPDHLHQNNDITAELSKYDPHSQLECEVYVDMEAIDRESFLVSSSSKQTVQSSSFNQSNFHQNKPTSTENDDAALCQTRGKKLSYRNVSERLTNALASSDKTLSLESGVKPPLLPPNKSRSLDETNEETYAVLNRNNDVRFRTRRPSLDLLPPKPLTRRKTSEPVIRPLYSVIKPLTPTGVSCYLPEVFEEEKTIESHQTESNIYEDMEQINYSKPKLTHSWFIDHPTRIYEAERILHENQEFGNLIVSRREENKDNWKYTVTVGPLNQGKMFKHFGVREEIKRNEIEYCIFLGDKEHPKLATLESVVSYFVKESCGEYKPLWNITSQSESSYDTEIFDKNSKDAGE